ncbi:MAG: TatD family hydrolase [Raoultibacter sp.]
MQSISEEARQRRAQGLDATATTLAAVEGVAQAAAAEADQPVFRDGCFRQKRKKGKWRLVVPPALPADARIADTHAHLDLLADAPLALAQCALWGVDFVVAMADAYENPGVTFDNLEAWQDAATALLPEVLAATAACMAEEQGGAPVAANDALAFAAAYPRSPVPQLRIALGCHPHNAKDYSDALESDLVARLHDPRVCAIGEVGLDYHYDFSPRPVQREVFCRQIRLAHQTGLPLILHLREAHDEAMALMRQEGFPEAGTLLHCFNLDAAALAPWVDAGCSIAIGGPVTFKKSDDVRRAVALIPSKKLLSETDSPYMTPEPMRGGECGPAHTLFTAAALADVRGCACAAQRSAFFATLHQNALDLLDRKPTPWQQNI